MLCIIVPNRRATSSQYVLCVLNIKPTPKVLGTLPIRLSLDQTEDPLRLAPTSA